MQGLEPRVPEARAGGFPSNHQGQTSFGQWGRVKRSSLLLHSQNPSLTSSSRTPLSK